MRRRPIHVAFHVADVKKTAPLIARGIGAPTRNFKIVPAHIAAACVGGHDRQLAVR